MEALSVGMYIRTKDGIIAKILNIKDGYAWCDNVLEKIPDEGYNFYENDYFNIDNEVDLGKIKKASYNIIDILEEGDYVNGSKVIDISIIGKDKEKWVWVEQTEDTDNKYGDDYVGYNNEQIKSIVTKEQMEQMAYKVGE